MELNDSFYQAASQLPPEEIEQYLRKILPPARLAMLMDGTLFRFSEHGSNLFRIQTVLQEAGIPEDDPRTRMFNGLLGWLIDPAIPNRLRAIAHKQDTILSQVGAVKTYDEQGRKAWWVPLPVTGTFERRAWDWLAEFEQTRDQLLVDPYPEVYHASRERVLHSAEAAWDDLHRLGKTSGGKDDYLRQAEAIFTQRFPSPEQIRARIRLAFVPCQAPLPERLEHIYRKLEEKQREKEAAEVESIRLRTQKEVKQLQLLELDRELKQAERDRLKVEHETRQRLVREAVQPEIEQAQQVVLQVQSRVMRLCQDILNKVQQGLPVSPATRRSWNKTFKELSALTPDHPHLMEALKSMKDISQETKAVGPRAVANASRMIGEALTQIERRAAVTLNAEALWQLLQAGQAEEALSQLERIRGQLTGKLDEVESLYELMTELGAQAADDDSDMDVAEERSMEEEPAEASAEVGTNA